MFRLRDELKRLEKRFPLGTSHIYEYGSLQKHFQAEAELGLPRYGTVVDNKDPMCLGRVRVAADTIAPGAITGWIQVIAVGAGRGMGWWQLPDIGSQVLMAFVGKGHNNPVVIGCIYDSKNRPPKGSTKRACDSKLYQTKKHRMEFIDEEGRESIIISSAKGKIRLVLDKHKGIELINELGDIRIKCKKFKMAAGEEVKIEGKKVSLKSEENAEIKAGKTVKIECKKEVKIKGKNVRLEASRGITTEGKQLAAQGDKVMGFDIHQMVIPSGKGTAVVPLPHPFIGKLADKLSDNVKIKGHNAATKGSIAKHDNPIHNQLPGTIRFNTNPNKEGEVTGGTGRKLKINGKEAAVVGSTVSTCNDIGARDNSTILAPGASMPMPVIIHPKNMKEYREEREKENKRDPQFTNAMWIKALVKEGEETELSASVNDIADGNMVTFQVWREGQDPNVNESFERIHAKVEGGVAKGTWKYRPSENGEIPEDDPKYFFTAHSAWCPLNQSGNVTVELRRPRLSSPKWLNEEGKETNKGLVGKAIKLEVSCNSETEENAPVTFKVYKEGANPKYDEPVAERNGVNKEGTAQAEWSYYYKHDPENPLTEKPKYFFTAVSPRCKEEESGKVEIGMEIDIPVCDYFRECLRELEYTITGIDGTEEKGKTTGDGRIKSETLLPGDYEIRLNWEDYKEPDTAVETIDVHNIDEQYSLKHIDCVNKELIVCSAGIQYMLIAGYNKNNISS